ncbi:MAG TPA: hypothetical protein PLK95_03590, partial [Pseudothermotoga sp.]|nr:hypothetical protein [Pseudothermotoga sp.]HPP69799.1 hypothetical protein [Pseudothermotoga sp.]
MARSEIAQKVDKLEQAIMELVYSQRKTEMQIQNLTEQFVSFQNEVREANRKRDEGMEQLRKEMIAFKNEMA